MPLIRAAASFVEKLAITSFPSIFGSSGQAAAHARGSAVLERAQAGTRRCPPSKLAVYERKLQHVNHECDDIHRPVQFNLFPGVVGSFATFRFRQWPPAPLLELEPVFLARMGILSHMPNLFSILTFEAAL